MIENIDIGLVDWSRGQFALTAIVHWFFVPLTLGLSFIIAFMETLYVKTGNEEWKRITKYWMTLFGINFAIGVATGIILEFEFGTNWSNYSWFVGDIFGAPLAIEGMMAFFMESTFVAVMFFGWKKVSKRFHLISTWLVAFGASLSALWILVANAWMQSPVGVTFNPDTARNEMIDFWAVILNPAAVEKFLHTISSGFIVGSVFVVAISSWYLLKGRDIQFFKKSILIAAVFGIISSLYVVFTGDLSSRTISKIQPIKFAASEGMFEGEEGAGLVLFGVLADDETIEDDRYKKFAFKVEIPKVLSLMTYYDGDAYVAGINDHIKGNKERGIMSATEKIERGKVAHNMLRNFKDAKKNGSVTTKDGETMTIDEVSAKFNSKEFQETYFKYFGYGYFTNPDDLIPNVPFVFYSFRLMVMIGLWFILLMSLMLFFSIRGNIHKLRWLLWAALLSLPLAYIAGETGWIVAEMGRQPWAIQDLLPVMAAVSNIDSGSVIVTFVLFAVIFSGLLIAEVKIMLKQIKIGPKH